MLCCLTRGSDHLSQHCDVTWRRQKVTYLRLVFPVLRLRRRGGCSLSNSAGFCLVVRIVQETVLIWGAVKHRDTVNHGAMLHPQYTAGWIFHQ